MTDQPTPETDAKLADDPQPSSDSPEYARALEIHIHLLRAELADERAKKSDALIAAVDDLERLTAERDDANALAKNYAERMARSDAELAAARATPDASGWLVLPADLPLVRGDTLRAVADGLAQHAVVVPLVQGQRGHPVGFSAACGPALRALDGAHGAASVVRAFHAFELPLDDIGCITDIDTLADLRAAQALLEQRP